MRRCKGALQKDGERTDWNTAQKDTICLASNQKAKADTYLLLGHPKKQSKKKSVHTCTPTPTTEHPHWSKERLSLAGGIVGPGTVLCIAVVWVSAV
jgi:hypothetical protein